MRRREITPMWPTPDTRYFRCPQCKAVLPEYRWTPQEAQRYGREGKGMKCEGCYMTFQGAEIVWDERD